MRRTLMIALLFCSMSFTAHMQDESPWPPKAADIFVPGIQVLEFNMLDKVQQSPLGKIAIIPEYRVIKGADGRVYPWPESVPFFQLTAFSPVVVNDLLYLYQTRDADGGGLEKTWTLNLSTGVFNIYDYSEMPATPCGKMWPRAGWNGWDEYWKNDQLILCNFNTGEQSSYPSGYSLPQYYETNPSFKGATDGRLIMMATQADTTPYEITVFVRNPVSKEIDNLGMFPVPRGQEMRMETKRGNIVLIIVYDRTRDYAYGVFNPNTNKLIRYTPPSNTSSLSSEWSFWPNPNVANMTMLSDNTCAWVIYDLFTNQESTFPVGDLCYADFIRADGTGYYRQVSPDKKSATVISYNPITKKRQSIYEGEIEKVTWASEDDHYLSMVTDDSGQIDSIPYTVIRPHASGHAIFKLIDLRQNKIVFQTPAVSDGQMDLHWLPRVNPFTPNWLALGSFSFTSDKEDTLIHFLPDGIRTQQINIEYKINGEWASYSDENSFGLYHLPEDRRIPIFKNPPRSRYLIKSLVPLGGGQFEVIVKYFYWPADEPSDMKLARFVIKLPAVNLPTMVNTLSMQFSTLESDGYVTDSSEYTSN